MLIAIDWESLMALGVRFRARRLTLLKWSCETSTFPRGNSKERLSLLGLQFPMTLPTSRVFSKGGGRMKRVLLKIEDLEINSR